MKYTWTLAVLGLLAVALAGCEKPVAAKRVQPFDPEKDPIGPLPKLVVDPGILNPTRIQPAQAAPRPAAAPAEPAGGPAGPPAQPQPPTGPTGGGMGPGYRPAPTPPPAGNTGGGMGPGYRPPAQQPPANDGW